MTGKSTGVTFHKSPSANPSEYFVHYDGVKVGTVVRFQMGAGQFGSSWMATTLDGRASNRFMSRDAAAAWLVDES